MDKLAYRHIRHKGSLQDFANVYAGYTTVEKFCLVTQMPNNIQLSSTASAGTLLVPRARTATGQRSFAINGPRTWNSLPADLRTP